MTLAELMRQYRADHPPMDTDLVRPPRRRLKCPNFAGWGLFVVAGVVYVWGMFKILKPILR